MRDITTNILRNSELAVLSAHRTESDAERNALNNRRLQKALDDMGASFKPMVGCYEGEIEGSFLVLLTDRFKMADVLEVADRFHQDCVMKISARDQRSGFRHAKLVFPNFDEVELGRLHGVSGEEAKEHIAWTYCPQAGQYYIAK